MGYTEEYLELLNDIDYDYLELKGYVWVGYSQKRLNKENMPYFTDMTAWAEEFSAKSDLKIIGEKEESRVILLSRKHKEPQKVWPC